MPCMCWYDPPEASKRLVKYHCEQIIAELHRLHADGDPMGLELKDVKELLDHFWDPKLCSEKNSYTRSHENE